MEDVKGKIRSFIIDNFLFGEDEGLDDQVSFLDNGIVDSMGILEIVNFITEEFQVVIADEDLLPENLDSIDNIANYLKNRLQAVVNS
jgi:acyl carrier protein